VTADADDVTVSRRLRMIVAGILIVVGIVGCLLFLRWEGLDRAEKWVSLVGVFVSVAIGVAGLALSWLSWRHGQSGQPGQRPVHSSAPGAVAVGGDSGAEVVTEVSGVAGRVGSAAAVLPGTGVTAGGVASVAIGGDSAAPIRTRFSGAGGSTGP
jgi:hypothetical protein